jgi:formylglycine-generating enzyme required for sulfatase activity
VNPSYFKGDTSRPVEQVTWFDAVLYCNNRSKRDGMDTVYKYMAITGTAGNGCTGLTGLAIDFSKNGYRLPTEAQWEYACNAGSTTSFYWGKDYDPYPATTSDTAEVGSYCVWLSNSYKLGRSNPAYGPHSVATKLPNAWGLYDMSGNVWEWCNDWYNGSYYASSPSSDPAGPASGTSRVLRGGSWTNDMVFQRSEYRYCYSPDYRYYNYGLRVVIPAP